MPASGRPAELLSSVVLTCYSSGTETVWGVGAGKVQKGILRADIKERLGVT